MSCHHSLVYRTNKIEGGAVQIKCCYNPTPVTMPDDVDYCNKYSKRGEIGLDEMKQIGKVLEVNVTKAGFQSS